jgi:hypothetical protein
MMGRGGRGTGIRGVLCGVVWCCLGLSGVVWYRLVFDIRGEGRAAGIPGLELEWHSKASGESRRWECLCPGSG